MEIIIRLVPKLLDLGRGRLSLLEQVGGTWNMEHVCSSLATD